MFNISWIFGIFHTIWSFIESQIIKCIFYFLFILDIAMLFIMQLILQR